MKARQTLRTRVPILPATYRTLRYPSSLGTIWKDLLTTSSRVRKLFPITDQRSGKAILFVLSSDMIYEAKLLMLLAAEIAQNGYRPIAVIQSKDPIHIPLYCRAFGVREHIYLDRISGDAVVSETKGTRPWGPSELSSIKALRNLSYEGVDIGVHALATISRRHHVGSVAFHNPKMMCEVERELDGLVLSTRKAQFLLEKYRPVHVICNESKGSSTGPLLDLSLAMGIDVIQLTQPWRDDALMCKRLTNRTRRTHPSSVERETFDRLGLEHWDDAKEGSLRAELISRYSGEWAIQSRNQPQTSSSDPGSTRRQLGFYGSKRIAVIFSHILWDANLFYGEDLFDDYGHWFKATLAAAAKNDSVNWVVKLHPASLWKMARERHSAPLVENELMQETIGGPLPAHMTVLWPDTPISTHALYEHTDYGVTVRGTAGMEMPCFGKPVLTAGTGRYSGLGFTTDSQTRGEYLDKLDAIATLPPLSQHQVRLARLHAYIVFCRRPWFMKSVKSHFNYPLWGSRPLDHNFKILARDRQELEHNADLAALADWVLNDSSADYINDL